MSFIANDFPLCFTFVVRLARVHTHSRWQSERVKHSGHNKGTAGWYYIVRGSVQMVTVSQVRLKDNVHAILFCLCTLAACVR